MKQFSEMSGLKLNVEKTSCMPIGDTENSNIVNNYNIKWVDEMKILGVLFSRYNKDITERNMQTKLVQIQNDIISWNRRKLTPLGKITVIKSLLISKIVHLLTALPNPSKSALKELEKLFFNFIWGGKRDPIKRAKLTQTYANGGLRMVDITAFTNSLKLTWLKRMMTSENTWVRVANLELGDIQNILCYGTVKLNTLCKQIQNPFWVDVLHAYSQFTADYFLPSEDILSEKIWFSDYTKFKNTIIKQWDEHGLRFISDLFDENTGRLHTKESVETKYNIKMTFLCYQSLIRSLPLRVKNIPTPIKINQPGVPKRIHTVLDHVHSFHRIAYKTYMDKINTKMKSVNEHLVRKWTRDIGSFTEDSLLDVIQTTNSTYIRCFHFKLENRIISTNVFLNIIGILDHDKCSFCGQEKEKIIHLYWHCHKVQYFIQQIDTKIFVPTWQEHIKNNPNKWFFPQGSKIQVLVITLAKLIIHESRLKFCQPTVAHLIKRLKLEAEIENFKSKLTGKENSYNAKWHCLNHLFIQQD